jgi:3-oxoadipate enol-lactonase
VPIADVNGLKVNYLWMDGQGESRPRPIIVFIHGLLTDSLASFYLTMAAPISAAGIDLLAYDLRAHGRSGAPPTGYTVGHFRDDLLGLLDTLGIDRPVHLVGNSFGGTLAFSVAAARPDRVASVVSIESEPATQNWATRVGETLTNTKRDFAREDTYVWLAATFGAHHARLSRAAYRRMVETTIVEEIPSGPLLSLEDLDQIRCPTMTIIGSEGFQADDPYLLESMLPNCRTMIIEDQDHSVLVEAHREVRAMVIDWVFEQHLTSPLGDDETAGPAGRSDWP